MAMAVAVNEGISSIGGPGSMIDERRGKDPNIWVAGGGGTSSCENAGWDDFGERCELDLGIWGMGGVK